MGTCFSVEDAYGRNRVSHKEGENPDQAADVTTTSAQPKKEEVDHKTIPFPKNGIKLSYILNEFIDECGGKEALEGLTTKDICDQFVIPATQDYELSYCDMILEKAKANAELNGVVKTATVFISHAWKYKFLDVLSALEDHFKDEPDKIVWFDVVSNNQHKGPELPYEWWATTFKDAIDQLGHTVMVMAPWNDPIPYKRAWCIFEAYCTSVTNAKFEIAMSNNERQAFIEECKHGPTIIINKMLSIVNAEKSQSWNPKDKERIHYLIRKEIGFANINSMVFDQLRDWVLIVALSELEKVENDSKDEADLMNLVGTLYKDQGKYDKVEPLYKECLAKREAKLGSDHPDTLMSMNNLAELYESQGKHNEAEPLYKECLTKRGTILGSDHPDTLESMNNLAGWYTAEGKYNEAEPLYKECLTKRIKVLGRDHPDTLVTKNKLVVFHGRRYQTSKTNQLYKNLLENRKTKLGSDHPDTLMSMNNLAELYGSEGKYSKAEPLLKDCLKKYKTILGPDHPDTLEAMNNLATLYFKRRKLLEAEPLLKECLAKRKRILGSTHPDTLQTIDTLTTLYFKQREPHEDSLAEITTILGPDHPDTLKAMGQLVTFYYSQGKYEKAEPLYKDILAMHQRIQGPDHPDTFEEMKRLAGLYSDWRKFHEAEPLYKDLLAVRERILGPKHLDTLTAMNDLACLYGRHRKFEKAKSLLRECLGKLHSSGYGFLHPLAIKCRQNIDYFHEQQYYPCVIS